MQLVQSDKGKPGQGENSSDGQSASNLPAVSALVALAGKSGQAENIQTPSNVVSLNKVLKSGVIGHNPTMKATDEILKKSDNSVNEPEKKRARLDDGISEVRTSDTMSVDSGIEMSSLDQQSALSKNINTLNLNSSLVETSKSDSSSIDKRHLVANVNGRQPVTKLVKRVDSPKSVFDIIVQHNIQAQAKTNLIKLPPIGTAPMVFIPETGTLRMDKSKELKQVNSLKNINNKQIPKNLPENSRLNMNVQETRDRIIELKLQAFGDWSRCLSPDNNGNIPLHRAVLDENLTLVKRQCVVLCARKASLDVLNNDRKTPLHIAVNYANTEMVKMLLSFGSQCSVKDGDGNTALHLGVKNGNLDIVNALLDSSNATALPLDDFNDDGLAPLHLCAICGKVAETRALISKGADVNLRDARSGRTALFHSVEANNGDLVKLLLQNNASTNEPNFAGHTPLTAASEISYNRFNFKEYTTVPDGIKLSSKLVSLSSGENIGHILDDGKDLIFRGEIVDDVNMVEVPESEVSASCYSNTAAKKAWMSND